MKLPSMPLKNKKVIITGGPTREWIDPVRFISNPSTGKMGIAIADEAVKRSRETVFIHGPIDKNLLANKKYRIVSIETAIDLLNAVVKEITPDSVLIMAAAPADYTPKTKSEIKIKKEAEGDELTIIFKKNPDILKIVSRMKSGGTYLKNLFIAGFAAETNDIENNALEKLQRKKLDMICLNDVTLKDSGFGSDSNLITIYTKYKEKIELPLLTKAEAARRILDIIELEIVRSQ